jgi:hypothetical protein
MKKLLISTVFGILLASPAFAQSYSGGYGTGNVIDQPALEHGGFAAAPTNDAFAYAPEHASVRHARSARAEALPTQSMSTNDPDTVYESGQYVGRDPDPNVRLELRRDWTHD